MDTRPAALPPAAVDHRVPRRRSRSPRGCVGVFLPRRRWAEPTPAPASPRGLLLGSRDGCSHRSFPRRRRVFGRSSRIDRRRRHPPSRRVRRGRCDRHQRRPGRDHPAHVRPGRRPVRSRPPRRTHTRLPQLVGTRRERRRPGRAAIRRGHPYAVPRRRTQRHRPRLCRRLAGPARATRPPPDRGRPGARHRARSRRVHGARAPRPLRNRRRRCAGRRLVPRPRRRSDPHPTRDRRRSPRGRGRWSRRLVRRRVRRRAPRHRRRTLHPRRPRPQPGGLGGPDQHRCVGAPRVDRAAELAGLPVAAGRRHPPRRRPR